MFNPRCGRIIFVAVIAVLFCCSLPAVSLDTGTVSSFKPASEMYGGQDKYAVILRDAELKEALRFLAKVAGLNIIIPEDLTGVVNVSFGSIAILDAMNSIIRASSLDYAIERGIMRIGKTGQFTTTGEDLKTETIRLKYATAKDLTDKVKSLLTDRGSVLSDSRTNSLVVRERLANIENVKRFVGDIDVRDAQVLIEAKIVEATRDFSRNLGIQWGINMSGNKGNVLGVTAVGQDDLSRNLNVNLPAANATSGLGLLIGMLKGNTNIDVQLTAAEQRGDAHVISEPSIVTSNGVTAKIRSGETLLIKTTGDLNIGSATTTGDTGLHQIETGVELNVTPQISGDGLVKLKIDAETSQADFSREVEGIPVIIDSTASTEVLVVDGQTTVIGGLFKFTGNDTVKKVPFFSEVPVLGNLFKSRARSKRNTELMIFIKPSIAKPYDDVLAGEAKLPQIEEDKKELMVEPMKKKRRKSPQITEPTLSKDNSRATRYNQYLRDR